MARCSNLEIFKLKLGFLASLEHPAGLEPLGWPRQDLLSPLFHQRSLQGFPNPEDMWCPSSDSCLTLQTSECVSVALTHFRAQVTKTQRGERTSQGRTADEVWVAKGTTCNGSRLSSPHAGLLCPQPLEEGLGWGARRRIGLVQRWFPRACPQLPAPACRSGLSRPAEVMEQ